MDNSVIKNKLESINEDNVRAALEKSIRCGSADSYYGGIKATVFNGKYYYFIENYTDPKFTDSEDDYKFVEITLEQFEFLLKLP